MARAERPVQAALGIAAALFSCGAPAEAPARSATCRIYECGIAPDGADCGACPEPWTCRQGSCSPPCGDLTEEGCCDGGVFRYCFEGRTLQAACVGPCGWNPAALLYECGYEGEHPSGRHPRTCPPIPPPSRPRPH